MSAVCIVAQQSKIIISNDLYQIRPFAQLAGIDLSTVIIRECVILDSRTIKWIEETVLSRMNIGGQIVFEGRNPPMRIEGEFKDLWEQAT